MSALRDITVFDLPEEASDTMNMTLEQMIEMLKIAGIEVPRKGRMSQKLYTSMVRNKLGKALEGSRNIAHEQYVRNMSGWSRKEIKRLNDASVAVLI